MDELVMPLGFASKMSTKNRSKTLVKNFTIRHVLSRFGQNARFCGPISSAAHGQ
jgi:hypothetical protein